MNSIYKVIWSKAKNCYVVASEIARSHTKSASGSEKIGGVARHALLALGAACAIACGGFVNVGAVDYEVDVKTTGGSTATVYTKDGTADYVAGEIRYLTESGDVFTNKDNIATLQTTTTEQGKQIAINTTNIAKNKADINALQSELGNKADATALDTKADKSYVDTEVGKVDGKLANKADKATTLVGYGITDAYTREKTDELLNTKANAADVYTRGDIDTKLADVYSKTEVDGKITDEENARNIAIQNAINGEAENRKNAIDAAIAKEVADRNQAIKTEVDKEANARDTAIANAKNDLQTKITEEKTAREALDTRLTKAEDKITANETAIDNLKTKDTENVKYDNATVKDQITLDGAGGTKITNLKDADLSDSSTDAVTGKQLNKTNEGLKTEAQTRKDMDTLLSKRADALEKNTGGITRNDAKDETYIEKNVTVDNQGSITAKGKVTANGVDAGAVNAGSLNVTDASHLKGDVTMDNTLTVKGDASLNKTDVGGALNVTGASDLKGDVTLGTPNGTNTVTVNGTANFNAAVNMDKGLNVTNGETNLKKTTVDGDLKVTGTITTDKMVFGDPATNNYTEIDKGHITSKNDALAGDATKKSSSMELSHSKLEVGVADKDSNGHLTMTADKTSIKNSDLDEKNYSEIVADKDSVTTTVKDEKGNTTSTKSSATEIRNDAKDKDGNESSIVQTGKDITNTAEKGTIKNDAMNIENNASGNITNNAQNGTITNNAKDIVNNVTGDMTNEVGGKLTTTVKGQATENFNGGLNTMVTGEENHTVTGKQTNNVGGGQINNITGGQTNTITGGQINNITGDQTTIVTDGNISNTAKNITNTATEKLTDEVGTNTRVTTSTSITDSVGATTNRKIEDGKITDTAGDSTVTTENGKGTTFAKTDSAEYSTEAGAPKDTNIAGNLITTGRVDANELGVSDKDGANTADLSVKAGEGVKASAGNGTTTGSLDVKADEVGSFVKDDASGKGSTFKQRIDAIMGNVKTADGESEVTQKGDEITSVVGKGEATNSRVTQKKGSLEAAVTDGINTNVSYDVANASAKELTDGTKGNKLQDNLDSSEKTITNGTYKTSKLQTALDITNTAKDGTITNDAKNIVNNATGDMTNTVGGKQTNKIDGDQVNTIGGSQTTTVEGKVTENYKAGQATNVTGDQDITVSGTQTTTATDIKRNASSGMIDTIDNDYGTNTETKVAGKTTTDVSIKGTGEKGQYIRGANESRDYLIKGTLKNSETKTVEKTSTEITDGTNKASTIQDAKNLAGSVTNGTETGVSGIHANDDGSVSIDSGVTDGTNTSVQKQTASAIATDVKDGAGNENASVATATTSANTIKSGSKANTVISTADGTSFINSEAAAPVTGASGAGTAVDTTIKGNTITTGKVTMDYAEVMKDLGVHGSATVDHDLTVKGITTTKTLNVTENATVGGTLEVTKRATFCDDVDIKKNLSVDGNATIKGDVMAKSYKVGDKTYINADGINANDQKITNVADGSISEGSKDAVNGGQLYGVKRDLEHQVDKVGANAAAMANLRPMEFDPSSKWNIAAAIGNYGSETAAALGAFYRPNDDVMVNLSTAFGTGENMVGGGVSVRLGKSGNKLSREESNALKDQVNDLTARMDALLSVLNPNMSKDFPDVPENHWAYEAVSRLAGNDIVQGYPDGEFHGERTMTRYEMAEIIYNALSRGAEAERELVEEFKPELQAMAASEKATAEKAEG